MNTVHVVPVDDLIEHDSDSDDCPCGPTSELVTRPDGSDGRIVIHQAPSEGTAA